MNFFQGESRRKRKMSPGCSNWDYKQPKVTSVDTAGNFKSLMYIFSSSLMEQLDKG